MALFSFQKKRDFVYLGFMSKKSIVVTLRDLFVTR